MSNYYYCLTICSEYNKNTEFNSQKNSAVTNDWIYTSEITANQL